MVSKSSSGTFATLGSNIGSETKTLSVDNLPSHNHTFTGSSHTHSIPAHSHGLNNHTHSFSATTSESGAHAHRLRINLGNKYNPRVDDYINYGGYANSSEFNWTGSEAAHTHTVSGTTEKSSGSTANSSALTSGGTTQGGTIGNTGKGTALSVVQNSKVCIRWHRIS